MKWLNKLMILLVLMAMAITINSGWNGYTTVQRLDNLPHFTIPNINQEFKHDPLIRINGDSKSCSGVVINETYALTAAHCVIGFMNLMSKTSYMVYNTQGLATGVSAVPAALSLEEDVALIKGDFREFRPQPIDVFGKMMLIPGQQLLICGYPSNQPLPSCVINTFAGHYDFRSASLGEVILQGTSGGPVVDAKTGIVIGIISSVGGNYNYFGPVKSMLFKFGVL